jgi:sialate O-acetylesterase
MLLHLELVTMLMRHLVTLAVLAFTTNSIAAITVPSIFSDHMVLQRDAEVPIWGLAVAGSTVTVSFGDQAVTTKADVKGAWKATLGNMKASANPRPLTIKSDDDSKVFSDVLVGEVWVGSGQSNMAGRVANYAKNDETLAAVLAKAPFKNIRLMQGGPKPTWQTATPQTVSAFSAILFAFGERLQRDLDVPVGLIVGAVGGTPSGSWIPPETYASSKKCKAAVAEFSKTFDKEKSNKQYLAKLAAWEAQAAKAKAKAAGKKPRGRKPQPAVAPGESSRGGKIGGLYDRFIRSSVGYRIQGVLWDQGEARTGVVGVDQHTMMSELIRGWRDAWGQGEFSFIFVQKPSGDGVAFSNANPITRNGNKFSLVPVNANPGSLRGEDRYLYVRLMNDNPNAWMVPASDLGSGIHPTNKWGYGNRAAEVALSQTYKTGQQAYGPKYRSHSTSGSKIIVEFDHVGKGLTTAHSDQLQGFAVAGSDGNWHWASAKIVDSKVEVWSEKVDKPTQIRYAFSGRIEWANLFNKDGLPALTFEASK